MAAKKAQKKKLANGHVDLIENEEAMKKITALFTSTYGRYDDDRETFAEKVKVIDGIDQCYQNSALADQEKASAIDGGSLDNDGDNSETRADMASPMGTRLITQAASTAYSVVSSQEVPWKYNAVVNPEIWADTTEGVAQAAVRSVLAEWALKQDGFRWKQQDIYRDAVKYSHAFVLFTMAEHKQKVLVLDAKTGKVVEKEINTTNYPRMEMIHPLCVWADKDIDGLKDQSFVFTTGSKGLYDVTLDEFTSEEKYNELVKEWETYKFNASDNPDKEELQANAGETSGGSSETDLREWNVYARLRLDASGELSTAPEDAFMLYRFVGYGKDPAQATWIKCMSNFDPDGEIPIEIYPVIPSSGNGLYHPMLVDAIRPLYAADCVLQNYEMDAIGMAVDPPRIWNTSKLDKTPEDGWRPKIGEPIYASSTEGVTERVDIGEPSQLIAGARARVKENEMLAAWISLNMLGIPNGGRTSATESMGINRFSMQPQLAWVSYFTSHLFGDAGRKFSRYWETFGDPKVIKAIAGEAFKGKVDELYGEFDIEVDVVDEYIDNQVQAQQSLQLFQMATSSAQVLQSDKMQINFPAWLQELMKTNKIKNASRIVTVKDGEAALWQRTENTQMLQTGQYIEPNQEQDHAAHTAEVDAELLRYNPFIMLKTGADGEPFESDGDATTQRYIEMLQAHKATHEQMAGGGQQGAQAQQAPQASPNAPTEGQLSGGAIGAAVGATQGGLNAGQEA